MLGALNPLSLSLVAAGISGVLLSQAPAASAQANPVQTLAYGNYFTSGSISSTYRWQSSGILVQNGCPRVGINLNCFKMYLDATGMLETDTDPTTRRDQLIDPELIAAQWDDALDYYYDAFPEQLPERFPSYFDTLAGKVVKRQVSGCGTPTTTTPGGPTSTTTTTSAASTTTAPPTPRQRIEMLSWPGAPAGEKWAYTWRTYQNEPLSTTYQFFHTWQILRRDGCGGPVITLDLKAGSAVIGDLVRGCTNCASTPVANFLNKVIYHQIQITYGLNGAFSYAATVPGSKRALLSYKATGDMGSSASLKFGQYRRVGVPGISTAEAYVGQYVAKRLA